MIDLPPDPPVLVGQASVVDGDTLQIQGQTIRLWGIDAPEGDQTCERAGIRFHCGPEAAAHLGNLIQGRTVTCEVRGQPDRYSRTVGVCFIDYGMARGNLGEEMVRSGWALDYRRYSRGDYAAAEGQARSLRSGLWMGRFQKPWDWRARDRQP